MRRKAAAILTVRHNGAGAQHIPDLHNARPCRAVHTAPFVAVLKTGTGNLVIAVEQRLFDAR